LEKKKKRKEEEDDDDNLRKIVLIPGTYILFPYFNFSIFSAYHLYLSFLPHFSAF